MIFFNKFMLDWFQFPFPVFLCTWHMLLATVLTRIMAITMPDMVPGVKEKKVDFGTMKTKILPVSCLFAMSLILSNKAYIYLSVSYIQMLKAFTPVSVLLLSFLSGLERCSVMEMYIVCLICIGVALTSAGETFFSWTGFTLQSLAICAESSRLVLTNVLLKELKLDPLTSLYHIAPPCAFLIGALCLYFEAAELPWERILTPLFGTVLIANGLVAFALNVAVVMLIGNTSALVLTLAGIVKDLLIVTLSVALFGAPITNLQCVGYGISLVGLNLHKEYKKGNLKQLLAKSMGTLGLVDMDMDMDKLQPAETV